MLAFEKICVRTKWMILKVIHSFIRSFTCGFLMFSRGIERTINMKWIKGICELRGGSRTAATLKMEHFVIIVNGWKPLTIITERSILDVAAFLDPPPELILFSLLDCLRQKSDEGWKLQSWCREWHESTTQAN